VSASIDPFEEWRVSPTTPSSVENPNEDPFAEFRPQEEQKPSLLKETGRHVGRSLARVSETVLGAPRALGEFLEGFVPEKALVAGAKKIGIEKPVSKSIEFAKEHAPYKLFPTSENVREFNKALFGENVEAKNSKEKLSDDIISDFAALAIPVPGKEIKLLKPALLSLGANTASEIIGKLGGTNQQKAYTKLGTILFGSLINPKSAQNFKNGLYEKAREARPPDASVSALNLKNHLNDFKARLEKGGSAPSKTKSIEKINELEGKIKNNRIDVEELEEFKKTLNEARAGLYTEYAGNKYGRKLAKSNLDRASGIVDDALKEYGQQNPIWDDYYRSANEVHGAIAQSYKARNQIGRVAKKYGLHAILPALGLGHALGASAIPGAIGTAVAGAGLLGAGELAVRFAKSPALRKHYTDLINSAMKETAVSDALIHEQLKKLKKDLEKENLQ
jgi:hypothetical protein